MTYNRFTFHIILRVLLIFFNLIGISYLYDRGDLMYTLLFTAIVLIFQISSLVQFVNKTNDELSKFILALRDADYTTKFPKAENESFDLLYSRFQHTLDLYKSKETKYEAQFLFTQELVDNIETGLLAFDENNKVVMINRVARQLRSDYRFDNDQSLIAILENLKDSQIIKGQNSSEQKVELLINKSSFKLLNKPQTIFTFKDISSPLETKEIESWQKLIRILAHEIINSLTPITSLSETTLLILKNSKHHEELSDIDLSLKTIKDRSEGLLTFMEDYRKLIKVPLPKPTLFNIEDCVKSILHLFKPQLSDTLVVEKYDEHELFADSILVEQVIVNLMTNSLQALEGQQHKQIFLTYEIEKEWACFSIKDTGCGMDKDVRSKALIPFFTTKSSGSGIGLSLVQQIINLHRGRLEIKSKENEFTQISLLFPTKSHN